MTWIVVEVVRDGGTPQAVLLKLLFGPFDSELTHLALAQSRAQAMAALPEFEVTGVSTL